VVRFATLTLLILWPTAVLADIVVLYSGDRIHGRIISENADSVSLQRIQPKGNIRYVQQIKRSRIARTIRAETTPTSQPTALSPKHATATRPARKPMSFAEKQILLTDALKSWKRKNYNATNIRLSRLIHFTTDTERANFSATVEKKLEMTLADFAAEARLQAAIDTAKGRPIQLGRVSDYVIPALAVRLELAFADARHLPVALKGKSHASTTRAAASRRAHTIARWIDKPGDFNGSWPEAQTLARHVRFAQSLLTERLRIEPNTKKTIPIKAELRREWKRLEALLTALTPGQPKPKLTIDTEPARLPAENALEKQRRQWLEQRRQAELQHVAEEGEKRKSELLPE